MLRTNLYFTLWVTTGWHGHMQWKVISNKRFFISLLLLSFFSLSPCCRLDATCPVFRVCKTWFPFYTSHSSLNKRHNQCEYECRVHAARMAVKLCAARSTKWASDRHVRSFIQMMTATHGSSIYRERKKRGEKNWKLNSLILHTVRCVIKLC